MRPHRGEPGQRPEHASADGQAAQHQGGARRQAQGRRCGDVWWAHWQRWQRRGCRLHRARDHALRRCCLCSCGLTAACVQRVGGRPICRQRNSACRSRRRPPHDGSCARGRDRRGCWARCCFCLYASADSCARGRVQRGDGGLCRRQRCAYTWRRSCYRGLHRRGRWRRCCRRAHRRAVDCCRRSGGPPGTADTSGRSLRRPPPRSAVCSSGRGGIWRGPAWAW